MYGIIEQFVGKKSRKEEKRIQEVRRLRKIRIGPNPKQEKRDQNIAFMMDDIYMERFMKGKDDQKFLNKQRDFRNIKMIDYNKNSENYSKNFDNEADSNEDNTYLHQNVDFRNVQLIKSSLIDETFVNNITFNEKTKGIRETLANAKHLLGPPKKKRLQIKSVDVSEVLKDSRDLNEKKKDKRNTIHERFVEIRERGNSLAVTRQVSVPSVRQISTSSVRQIQRANNSTLSQQSPSKPLHIFKQPLPAGEEDIQQEINNKIASINLIKLDFSQDRFRSNSNHLSPKDTFTSNRLRQKSLFHLEEFSYTIPIHTSIDSRPTLLEIRKLELEKKEFEQKKQKIQIKDERLEGLRQKLGLVHQNEKKKNIELTIEKIQKDLDKIESDFGKCVPANKFRYSQHKPLTFSFNHKYNKPIKPEVLQLNTSIIQSNNSQQTNFNNSKINNFIKNIIIPSPQNLSILNNNIQNENLNIFDFIIQEDQNPKSQVSTLTQLIKRKYSCAGNLQLNDIASPKTTALQSPSSLQVSSINIDTNENNIKQNSIISNKKDQSRIIKPQLSNQISRYHSKVGMRSSELPFDFSVSPQNSSISNFLNNNTKFDFSQMIQLKLKNTRKQNQFQINQNKTSYHKEISNKVHNIFSQIDSLQKETREQAKEEIKFVNEQSKLIKQDLAHWQQEFNEYNTEVDKNLLKDIKEEIFSKNNDHVFIIQQKAKEEDIKNY